MSPFWLHMESNYAAKCQHVEPTALRKSVAHVFYAKGKYWAHVQKAQANKLFECREFEGLKLEMPKTSLHIFCAVL